MTAARAFAIAVVAGIGLAMPVHAAPARTLLIGDSIGLYARPYLAHYDIATNAAIGRKFHAGVLIAAELARRHQLPDQVVIELGSNGPIASADMQLARKVLSGHEVVFVTTYVAPWTTYRRAISWYSAVNEALLHAAIPGARFVRWDQIAPLHPDWLSDDGLHPTAYGASQLARLIAAVVG